MEKSYKKFTVLSLFLTAQLLAGHKALGHSLDFSQQLTLQNEDNQEQRVAENNKNQSNQQLIEDILNRFTLGNDGFYNRVLSPAKSLNEQKSDSDRTAEANEKIKNNLTQLIDAFDNAPEDQKAVQVEATLKALDPNFEKGQSGRIEFTDGKISAAFSRIAFVVEKENANADMVLSSFTSYKRSAKKSDYVFEYENFQDISSGKITEREGSDTSWFPPQAAPALGLGESIVIKKCRQILGWKCGTTLYHADQNEKFKFVFMGNHLLSDNIDNPYFKGDGRTKNQVAGSTAVFIVKESEKHILFAAADSTWNKKGLQFTSIIQSEYQKDLNKFKQRLMFDLGRSK